MKPEFTSPGRSERRTGILLLVTGLVVNKWLLGFLFAPDGSLDGERRIAAIAFFQVFCILSGLSLRLSKLRSLVREYFSTLPGAAAFIGLVSLTMVASGWGIHEYRSAHTHTVDMDHSAHGPTPEQRRWAEEFVRRCREAARRNGWFDFEKATADGFKLTWEDRAHYYNAAFLFDDQTLDPDRPEFLMYFDTARGKLLVGYMFFTRSIEERGPQPGGSLTAWHYHPWDGDARCAINGLLPVSKPDRNGECARGIRVTRSPEMMHVWFVDHPLGPYAHAMVFPSAETVLDLTLIHPMVVHFTIALFIVAIFLDVLGKATGSDKYHFAALINLVLAGVFAVAAVAAGMAAEVRLLLTHEAHQILDIHKLLGFSTLACILLLLGWRLKLRGGFPARGAAILYLALGLFGTGLTAGAAYLGGEMVYVRGVAVQAIDRMALERHARDVFGEYAADGGNDVHQHK